MISKSIKETSYIPSFSILSSTSTYKKEFIHKCTYFDETLYLLTSKHVILMKKASVVNVLPGIPDVTFTAFEVFSGVILVAGSSLNDQKPFLKVYRNNYDIKSLDLEFTVNRIKVIENDIYLLGDKLYKLKLNDLTYDEVYCHEEEFLDISKSNDLYVLGGINGSIVTIKLDETGKFNFIDKLELLYPISCINALNEKLLVSTAAGYNLLIKDANKLNEFEVLQCSANAVRCNLVIENTVTFNLLILGLFESAALVYLVLPEEWKVVNENQRIALRTQSRVHALYVGSKNEDAIELEIVCGDGIYHFRILKSYFKAEKEESKAVDLWNFRDFGLLRKKLSNHLLLTESSGAESAEAIK